MCLNKDPEDRPTAKDLLKHKFIKGAKKTPMLVDLIERRVRWLQVVGHQESDDDSEKEDKDKGTEDDDSWIFETIKDKKPHQLTEEEIQKIEKGPPSRVQNLKADPERTRSLSESSKPNAAPQKPAPVAETKPTVKSNSPSASPGPQHTEKPAPVEQKPVSSASAPPSQAESGNPGQPARPSALTSVIYPVLSKLLKQNQEEGVIAALAQLKIAFDNAERAKPGITHQLIAQVIETLKR